MALITCKECGNQVSENANVCPNCGYNPKSQAQKQNRKGCKKAFLIILFVFLGFVLIGVLVDSFSDDKQKVNSVHDPVIITDSSTVNLVSIPGLDSVKMKELSPLFKITKDEFEGHSWVQPKAKPQYRNRNAAYAYFAKDETGVSNFRFVIQYAAEDWLFINSVKFNIDGQTYDYYTSDWERDHHSEIWEWSDKQVSAADLPLIEAIANGKSVKYRLNGRQYYKDKVLSENYKKSIKNTLAYYRAMGGKFY